MTSLTDEAYVGELHAQTLSAEHTNIPFAGTGQIVGEISVLDDGNPLPTKGLFVVNSQGGDITMSLADGEKIGDCVEVIYFQSGGFSFNLNVSRLHGAPKTITTGPASSGLYYKLVWATYGSLTGGWILCARESVSAAAIDAVEGLPVIA